MPHVTVYAKNLFFLEPQGTIKDATTKTPSFLISHFSFLSLSLSLSRFLSLSFSFLPAHFCNNSQIESQVSWTDLPSSCTGLSVHRHLAEIFAICLGTTESIKKPSADHSTHYPLNKQISTKLQHSLEISLSSLDWLNGRAPKCNQPSHRKNTP